MNGVVSKPEMEFKVGAVRAAIWTNPRMSGDGRLFDSHKVIVERFYKDQRGSFQTTSSLDTNDIPKAILALKKAYEYLTMADKTRPTNNTPDKVVFAERIP